MTDEYLGKGNFMFSLLLLLGAIAVCVFGGLLLMGTGKTTGSMQHRIAISIWSFGPFIAALIAPSMGISQLDLAVFVGGFLIPGFGITVGYHRLFTHQSFSCGPVLRSVFAISGMMAIQGAIIPWVGYHREHHADTDGPTDPHSPHAYGTGFVNATRGLVHAHIGWMFDGGSPDPKMVKKLSEDVVIAKLNNLWWVVVALRLILPFGVGYAVGGLNAGVSATLWGAAAAFLTLHSTFAVNSVCHMWGSTPFKTDGFPKNFWLLAPLTLGEAFHNGHHAFVWSARHGLTRFERSLDISWWLIWSLEKAHLVWDVKVPTPEQIAKQRVVPAVLDKVA